MNDSISRKLAIDSIMAAGKIGKLTCCDILRKLPSAQPEQRWIPCSERLPENNTRVIVWMAWGGFSMLDYQYNNFYGLNSVNNIPSEAVTAWMPLPEPYAERRTDEN